MGLFGTFCRKEYFSVLYVSRAKSLQYNRFGKMTKFKSYYKFYLLHLQPDELCYGDETRPNQ